MVWQLHTRTAHISADEAWGSKKKRRLGRKSTILYNLIRTNEGVRKNEEWEQEVQGTDLQSTESKDVMFVNAAIKICSSERI